MTVRLGRVRRGSLTVLALIVAEYLCYTACLYLLPRQRG